MWKGFRFRYNTPTHIFFCIVFLFPYRGRKCMCMCGTFELICTKSDWEAEHIFLVTSKYVFSFTITLCNFSLHGCHFLLIYLYCMDNIIFLISLSLSPLTPRLSLAFGRLLGVLYCFFPKS